MPSHRLKSLLILAAAPALAVAGLAPSGVQGAAPVRTAAPAGKVIILLRHPGTGVAPLSRQARRAFIAQRNPVIAQLRSEGVRSVASVSLIDGLIATVTRAQARALASNPNVARVLPNASIPEPVQAKPQLRVTHSAKRDVKKIPSWTAPCGTALSPEIDPEALQTIHATDAQNLGFDGAGVKVAFLADGMDPTIADFQRNAAYASAGSPAGSRVIYSNVDFSADGTSAPTAGGEAFGDASSIAAQGNTVFDLSQFVNAADPLPSGCDIKIIGAAPGSSVMALRIFSSNHETTASNYVEAINYAVSHGVKVINESFGSNSFPDTAQDVVRLADEAAVQAGVTVVASSGDAGITSTIGSPATDPSVIDVGASTTFRAYTQDNFGGVRDPNTSGTWVNNNISSLSSGGFAQSGRTVDLVAPGDLNWALCSPNVSQYSDCTNDSNNPASIQLFGGTSESSPLTAGAAADVIQAYRASHAGAFPSPALVKQILTSTATDINAPATEQGAGLLNVLGAVKLAQSIPGTTVAGHAGGLLLSPTQINVNQLPGATTLAPVTIRNTGTSAVKVNLSTRTLGQRVGNHSGSFCMQPGTPVSGCPANTGTFKIWSGFTEVYQDVPFTVPATSPTATMPSRLEFSADYQNSNQTSLLHFALIQPDGAYAAYSLPQGLADYGEVEVANPVPGTWKAVFFTVQNGGGNIGTSGTIEWDAQTFKSKPASALSTSSLTIGAGATKTATVHVKSPNGPGDSWESVVLSTPGNTTTIPVTIRTAVPVKNGFGSFSGVITGGNGRGGAQAQMNTYDFNVPKNTHDIDVSVGLANDPLDGVIALLVNPQGQTLGYSTNDTTDNFGAPFATSTLDMFDDNPMPGTWEVILQIGNPVSGNELSQPFEGIVRLNKVRSFSNLPHSNHTILKRGKSYQFQVGILDSGASPEAFFVDPRQNRSVLVNLPDQNGSSLNMRLPLSGNGINFPYYILPTHTSQIQARWTANAPIAFDIGYFPGDPDVDSLNKVVGSHSGHTASITLGESQITPGLWLMNPSEVGPYPISGAPVVTASGTFKARIQAFDPTVSSTTGDFWSAANGLSPFFSPNYVTPGNTANIGVSIQPTAAKGSIVTGTVYVDDYLLASNFGFFPAADELVGIPIRYKVG